MRSRQAPESRFWIISALVHGVIFTVFFFTLAGQRVFQPEERKARPEIIRKDEELAEVIDQIRALAVERLRPQVAAIEEISQRMEASLEGTIPRYQAFLSEQTAAAPDRLTREGERTLQLQTNLLEAIRASTSEPDSGNLRDTYESTRAALVAGQEEIRRALLLTAPDDTELVERQIRTEEDQFEVFELVATAVKARSDELEAIRRLKESRAEQERLQEAVEPTAKGLKELEGKSEPLTQRRKETAAIRQRAKRRVGAAEKQLEKDTKAGKDLDEARKALQQAEEKLKEAQEAAAEADQQRTDYGKRVTALKRDAAEQEKRLPELAKAIPSLDKRIPVRKTEFEESIKRALALQEHVVTSQRELHQRILSLLKTAEPESSGQTQQRTTP